MHVNSIVCLWPGVPAFLLTQNQVFSAVQTKTQLDMADKESATFSIQYAVFNNILANFSVLHHKSYRRILSYFLCSVCTLVRRPTKSGPSCKPQQSTG